MQCSVSLINGAHVMCCLVQSGARNYVRDITPDGFAAKCMTLLMSAGVSCVHAPDEATAVEAVFKHFRAVAEAPYRSVLSN